MMVNSSRVPKAVVVGCGLMGADIAAIFVNAGWTTTIVEVQRSAWDIARSRIEKSVEQLGRQSEHYAIEFEERLESVDWSGVRLVMECVPEVLDLKRTVFAELDRMAPQDVLIGSNSSGLPISVIAENCTTSFRMANAHFFLPAHLVPLVELAKGKNTSAATLKSLREIFAELGRVPVQIEEDLPGFLANRMQHALMREAFSLVDRGLATPEDVDAAVRYGFGFRYMAAGPILQKELSGLHTQLSAARTIYPSLCNDPQPSAGLAQLVSAGHLGAQTGQGYWRWTDEEIEMARSRYDSMLQGAATLLRSDIEGRIKKIRGVSHG
jgi:3-hydroxybutyryl-CoA dehydrogenase